jgi:protein ImuA
MANKSNDFNALKQRIRQLERLGGATGKTEISKALPLLPILDRLWPERGLPLGCLHEARSESPGGAAALTAFAGAIAGRLGTALWCAQRTDRTNAGVYGPGLAQVGLKPEHVLAVTAACNSDILAAMEEGLRHRVLACVVGEVARLNLTASRRLQLAAEKSGVTAFVLRTPPCRFKTELQTEPITAASRWRITQVPSAPHSLPEAGRAPSIRSRWRLELLQSRSGATGDWIIEAPDAQGHFRLPPPLADGFAKAPAAPVGRLAAG